MRAVAHATLRPREIGRTCWQVVVGEAVAGWATWARSCCYFRVLVQEEPVIAPNRATSQSALNVGGATRDALVRALGGNLLAAYLHGSAVLGGYCPDRSDLDVLALTEWPMSDQELEAVAANVAGGTYPARGLEMTLLTRDESLKPDLRAPRFQMHITTGGSNGVTRVVDGRNREGDRDLVLHLAVCRRRGLTLLGPPPDETLASVPAAMVRSAMLDEIEWATVAAPPEYLVLTSARAWLFGETGRIASKIEAGEWAARRYIEPTVVESAVMRQRGGAIAIDPTAAQDFARHAKRMLLRPSPRQRK